jgi:LPXTG-motif cell wall-anchored protein
VVILQTEVDVNVGGQDVHGIIADTCLLQGDSGGSEVVGNYAVGVNSGTSLPGAGFGCEEWSDDDISIGYTVASGDFNAFQLYGDDWELNVEVNDPSIDEALMDEGDAAATVSGSVENAGTDHRVEVNIDGAGQFESDLDADGEFSIEVEGLEIGEEYAYSAQAFYGNYSQSGVAEGTFTVEEGEPEPDVEELVVNSPEDGQTTGNARPPFEGTGEPGADIVLTVGDTEYGDATVADDGAWELTPESDLPRGNRFDADVTQTADDDVQTVTVSDLGIRLPGVSITVPEDGAEVAGDVVFEGTSFSGALIELEIEGVITASGDDLSAASDVDAAQEEWEGDFDIDEEGNWTFTPDEALQDGEYTLTARATAEDGDPELTDSEDSVDFTVATRDDDDDDDDDDLPDTGAGNLPLILVGVGLLAAGGGALALRARRSNASSNA